MSEEELIKVFGKFDEQKWSDFQNSFSDLIDQDSSLRGDLAHLFLGLRAVLGKGKRPLGHKPFAEEIKKFSDSLSIYTKNNSSNTKDHQPYKNFIQRNNKTLKEKKLYTNLFLYSLFVCRLTCPEYVSSFIFNEIGMLKELFFIIYNLMDTPNDFYVLTIKELDEFKNRRSNTKKSKGIISVIFEGGYVKNDEIIKELFDYKGSIEELKSKKSIERYFNCYRVSTEGGSTTLLKTFLVFQSPGIGRENCVFKIFYTFKTKKHTRKSYGYLLHLGDNVCAFGLTLKPSSPEDTSHSSVGNYLGMKSYSFDFKSIRTSELLIPGVLITVNDNENTILSRVIITKSNKIHSNDANIGFINKQDMEAEIRNNWLEYNDEQYDIKNIITELFLKLKNVPRNEDEFTLVEYTKSDIKISHKS